MTADPSSRNSTGDPGIGPQTAGDTPRKLRMTVSYDGTAYAGWQLQTNARTVQQELEEAVLRITGERTRVHGSGRTDAGVHAAGQSAHFSTRSRMHESDLKKALNAVLPPDVRVRSLGAADDGFHARFSAAGKTYMYAIRNHPDDSVHDRFYHWHVPLSLEAGAMREAASQLTGFRDFRAFSSVPRGKDSRRNLKKLEVRVLGAYVLVFAEADGFLWRMVRGLVGSLVEVGKGAREPGWPGSLQENPDRAAGAPSAPARGLTLLWVDYGEGPPDVSDLPPWLGGFLLAAR